METCGKCHPGATENFAQSKVHVDAAATSDGAGVGEQINWWVRRIYLVLIVGTIGFMLVHNLLLFGKKVRARYRAADLTVLRMNLSQRMQHVILAVSFIVLAVTGFALKFPDSWIGEGCMGSSEMFRSWSHRIAGVVLLVVGVYHIIYLLATREGRQLVKDFLPGQEGPEGRGGQRAVFGGAEPDQSRRSAASATRRRWSIGRWSGARSSWASPA